MECNEIIVSDETIQSEYNYADIYMKLKRGIEENTYVPGTRLPTESELSKQYQVKRFTVRKAIQKLISDGLVFAIRNKGYYVFLNEIHVRIRKESNYTQSMLDKKMTPHVKILGIKTVRPNHEQKEIFQLQEEELLWEIHVLRYYKNIPYLIGRSYIPYSRFPEFGLDFQKKLSIFKVFRETYSVKPSRKNSICMATNSDKKESKLLAVFENSPLLKVASVNIDQDNNPVEHCISMFRSDIVRISINLQNK